jgi:hypothetical protein
MPSLNQFKKLDDETRRALIERCILRKRRFVAFTKHNVIPDALVLIVGDCPAPSAPNDPEFHYTPFAALWNSSLFLNLGLHRAGVPESALAWVNAADFHKNPTPTTILEHRWHQVVALGGAAERWVHKAGKTCVRFDHPAYHTRFHGKTEYPLFNFLTTVFS